ncbi:RNA polymerase sigma factor [Demequina pelophila]|uniref:RNA polymerase sigma factor n=1 Tax=Demequina pelophila TaxID=1638984 RepID=UPI0007865955|nr:hypothetical protein [Demequina pelophila]
MDVDAALQAAGRGDRRAFDRVIDATLPAAWSHALAVCGDPDAAARAAERALVEAWRSAPALESPADARAWVLALAHRFARAERAGGPLPLPDAARGSLARLPVPQREALEACWAGGLTVDQAARRLDTDADTVALRLGGALAALAGTRP